MSKIKPQRIALWVLQILLAFMFLQVGFGKLWDGNAWAGQFRQWGYPERFYLAVGFAELLGGLAILVPRTAGYGSIVLMTVMGGATVHHLLRHETTAGFTLLLFAFLAIIAYARRPAFLRARQVGS